MPPLRIYTPRHTCRRGCTNTQLWEFWNFVLWWRAYRRGSYSRSSGAWLYRMCVFPVLSIFFLVQKKRNPFKKAVSPFHQNWSRPTGRFLVNFDWDLRVDGKIQKCEHPELWWCCSSFNVGFHLTHLMATTMIGCPNASLTLSTPF